MDNKYRDLDRHNTDTNEDYNEETAAEAMPLPSRGMDADDTDVTNDSGAQSTEGRGLGFFALALSLASLFLWPIVLGAAGIIIGFVAKRRGADSLGNWAIGLGAVSIIVSLLFAPFF